MCASDRRAGRWLAIPLCVMLWAAHPVAAQDPANRQATREREMLRRAQAGQKQAEEARVAVEEARAKTEAQLKETQAKAAAVESVVSRERRRAGDLVAELDRLQKTLATTVADRDAKAKAVAALELQGQAHVAEIARLNGQLTSTAAALATARAAGEFEAGARSSCEEHNRKLSGLFTELMDKYRNVSVWQALKRAEPFTGLERAGLESLLETYRERSDALRLPESR